MGSMIHLAVGRLEIDWGKNRGFRDHSAFFQITDLTKVPYWYVSDDKPTGTDEFGDYIFTLFSENKDGLSKPILQVAERIKMLGHTLDVAEKEFEYLSLLNGFSQEELSFEDLRRTLATVDVTSMSLDYGEGGEDFGKFFRREVAKRLGLPPISSEIGEGMENLSPETIILMLSENPSAINLPVIWNFSDLEEGGYEARETFIKDLEPSEKFLLVTEGSSDANIIRHALALLMPHISDFFSFVDMSEGYPFSGTGSQLNFAKGLKSIAVQNKVVFIFDNDAEGSASLARTLALKLPENMKAIKLPDLPEFLEFPTIGPSGCHNADINGRAAAIECYLDLDATALIRWTSYNRELDAYQGELINKTQWAKTFYKISPLEELYDLAKINKVILHVVETCSAMRIREKIEYFDKEIKLLGLEE